MKIIILSGENNRGKTTTLNLLYSLVEKIDGIRCIKRIPQGDPQQQDYDYLLENKEKRKILISTWGDYPDLLKKNCEKYHDYDAIVCACNINFMRNRVHKPFEEAMQHDKFTTILLKSSETDEKQFEEANRQCAEILLNLMKMRNIL